VRPILRGILLGAVWFGAWLLLVEKLDPAELVVGAICATIAAVASELAWGTHLNRFSGNVRALLQAWHLPWLMLSGTWEIFKVLFRHLFTRHKADSLMLAVDFDAGAPDDANDAMRRALAVGYTTMTPNFVVIGIDQAKGRMLYHQLARSEVPKMARNLGARP
jgi:multisubunit Na+/H+ antiporter MnhE subunit